LDNTKYFEVHKIERCERGGLAYIHSCGLLLCDIVNRHLMVKVTNEDETVGKGWFICEILQPNSAKYKKACS